MADSINVEKLKVSELRQLLSKRGLPTNGLKSALKERLQKALNAQNSTEAKPAAVAQEASASAEPSPQPSPEEPAKSNGTKVLVLGTIDTQNFPPEPNEGYRFGTVQWFDRELKSGFISPREGKGDVFVHASAIKTTADKERSARILLPGLRVQFKLDSTKSKAVASSILNVNGGDITLQDLRGCIQDRQPRLIETDPNIMEYQAPMIPKTSGDYMTILNDYANLTSNRLVTNIELTVGAPTASRMVATITIGERTWQATGSSKKTAKAEASVVAYKSIYETPEWKQAFTRKKRRASKRKRPNQPLGTPKVARPAIEASTPRAADVLGPGKNKMVQLNEYCQMAKLTYKPEFSPGEVHGQIVCTLHVGDDSFSATGSSKKLAKALASNIAWEAVSKNPDHQEYMEDREHRLKFGRRKPRERAPRGRGGFAGRGRGRGYWGGPPMGFGGAPPGYQPPPYSGPGGGFQQQAAPGAPPAYTPPGQLPPPQNGVPAAATPQPVQPALGYAAPAPAAAPTYTAPAYNAAPPVQYNAAAPAQNVYATAQAQATYGYAPAVAAAAAAAPAQQPPVYTPPGYATAQ